ncbi:hypothetical protein AMBR_BLFENHAL_02885 [Lacticaseibacillus rhamnosus]|nr:hypothetical protein AMBR_BLFENHAL_02885 [Lacticaseibacillus rhamnosus]
MLLFFFFQAEDGIRDLVRSRGLGDVYKRQKVEHRVWFKEAPVVAGTYAVELPLDPDFEFRADAGLSLIHI